MRNKPKGWVRMTCRRARRHSEISRGCVTEQGVFIGKVAPAELATPPQPVTCIRKSPVTPLE